jgi:alkylglycerol monooxygenase
VNEKYIALAIPFFFIAIALELLATRRSADPRYRFEDSITNLSCGVGQQVLLPFFNVIVIGGYILVYEKAALFHIPSSSWIAWAVLLFAVDLAYYVFHRASHRVNVFWAGHVVHHQSEEYNLSVALRQSWFDKIGESLFYLPLAVLGFPPLMFLAMTTLNTLYQFWIHTRAVGKLGPLEWVMNTPSHHRVHHGINPKYIDKNYGGIFIVWDRLFGTFKHEEEEPVYGIVKPLASFNPLWANVHYFVDMRDLARACPRLRDKLAVWIAPPEWRPSSLGGRVTIPEASRAAQKKYTTRVPRGLSAYVAVSFAIVGALTTAFLWLQESTPWPELAGASAIIVAALVVWGALFEGKRWALPLEVMRLALAAAGAVWLARHSAFALPIDVACVALAAALAAWVLQYRSALSVGPRDRAAVAT